MLIGAHVSTAGGLPTAIERGTGLGCRAIQIVNQSPRVWKPNEYGEEDYEAFNEARRESHIETVAIHTSYLVNCATRDSSIRGKSLNSLVHALRLGDAIGSVGVVVHAGSQKDDEPEPALRRSAEVLSEALDESERCPVLIEHSSGERRQLGRSFAQLAAILEHGGANPRLGFCLDTCHLYAQGYDVTTASGLDGALEEVDRALGLERLRLVHVNDARDPIGSRKDRHANLGEGTMGPDGLLEVLSAPRIEGVPAILETPGPDRKGPDGKEVSKALALRARGLARRDGSVTRARRRARRGLLRRLGRREGVAR